MDGLTDQNVIPFRSGHKASQQELSPLDCDPRLFPFGMLLVENRLFNGLDGFSWFASEALAVEYLRTTVWLQLGYSDEQECSNRSLFRSAFCDTSRMRWDRLDSINAEQDELSIVWFGSFIELFEGLDNFAKSVVSNFKSISRIKVHTTIEQQQSEFINHLQSYRSSMPSLKK